MENVEKPIKAVRRAKTESYVMLFVRRTSADRMTIKKKLQKDLTLVDFHCTHTLTTRKQDVGKTEVGSYPDKELTSWKKKTNLCGIDKEAKTQYNKTTLS